MCSAPRKNGVKTRRKGRPFRSSEAPSRRKGRHARREEDHSERWGRPSRSEGDHSRSTQADVRTEGDPEQRVQDHTHARSLFHCGGGRPAPHPHATRAQPPHPPRPPRPQTDQTTPPRTRWERQQRPPHSQHGGRDAPRHNTETQHHRKELHRHSRSEHTLATPPRRITSFCQERPVRPARDLWRRSSGTCLGPATATHAPRPSARDHGRRDPIPTSRTPSLPDPRVSR